MPQEMVEMSIIHAMRSKMMYKGVLHLRHGIYMHIDTKRSDMDRVLFKHGHHELHFVKFMKTYLKPGMTFVDVGANMGYFTLLAWKFMQGKGSIIAVEPDARSARILLQNLSLNNAKCTFVDKLLSNKKGVLPFHLNMSNPGMSKVGESETSLPCIRGDSLITHADLMKIDVEGHESEVLEGLKGCTTNHIYIDGWGLQ
jgi:FkbM family methyltransferase